jgi:hypothetical protein
MQAARRVGAGTPEEALQRSTGALRQARELKHPLMIGFALFFHAWIHQFRDSRIRSRGRRRGAR